MTDNPINTTIKWQNINLIHIVALTLYNWLGTNQMCMQKFSGSYWSACPCLLWFLQVLCYFSNPMTPKSTLPLLSWTFSTSIAHIWTIKFPTQHNVQENIIKSVLLTTKHNIYQLRLLPSFASPPNVRLFLHASSCICHSHCLLLRFRFRPILTKSCPLIGLNVNPTFFFPSKNHAFILNLLVFICLFTAFLNPLSDRLLSKYSNSLSNALLNDSMLQGDWSSYLTQLTSKILETRLRSASSNSFLPSQPPSIPPHALTFTFCGFAL